jgi:hypothetical protein
VLLRVFIKNTDTFPVQKCAIFCKFKEIGGIARRRTPVRRTSDSVDLIFSVIDDEIAEKGYLWTENSLNAGVVDKPVPKPRRKT